MTHGNLHSVQIFLYIFIIIIHIMIVLSDDRYLAYN